MATYDYALAAHASGPAPRFLPPDAPAPAGGVDLSVVVVNYNTEALLVPMRVALLAAVGPMSVELIVVDNASRDGSIVVLERDFRDTRVIVGNANVGFGRANNLALPHVRGRYVLLLNTDAFVSPDTLTTTVTHMDASPTCGILGVRLVGRDGQMQPCCRFRPTPWNLFLSRSGLARWLPTVKMVDDLAWPHDAVRTCDWVPGCYYLVRREVINQVGLFDPRYFMYYEEVDHCAAARRAGWEVHFFPFTSVVHLGGESAKSESALTAGGKQISVLQVESELLFFRKHGGLPGALATLGLSVLADAWVAFKHVLRMRPLAGLAGIARHQRDLWRLAWQTRLGRIPTR